MKNLNSVFIWVTEKDIQFLREYQSLLSYQYEKQIISGYLFFEATWSDIKIKDKYKIEIDFNNLNPLPLVKEVDGRIQNIAHTKTISLTDLHVNYNDINKGLCLCSRLKAFDYFEFLKTIDSPFTYFIKEMVIPFFYGISFFEKFNKYPFGELPHGVDGLIKEVEQNPSILLKYSEQYQRLYPKEFKSFIFHYLQSDNVLSDLIKENKKVGRNEKCPCNSGLKYKKCHLILIENLR